MMQFTGERYMPTEQGKIRLEHYHRYVTVLDAVSGKNVLDVACGEGYGSSILSGTAKSVIGVDISNEAVQFASGKYKKENLRYQQGSATRLDFPDGQFDVVVSFETIEHLAEQEQMVSELRRVLRPDGILIISSPNRPIYTEESGEVNHFHVKELDFNEFDDLLKRHFPFIAYFGQRITMGSVIQPLNGCDDNYRAWQDTSEEIKPGAARMIDPVYFLAVCSATQVPAANVVAMSVLYPTKVDLVKHYVSFAKWAQNLDKVVVSKDAELAEQRLATMEMRSEMRSEIHRLEAYLAQSNALLDQKVKELLNMANSSSWRITLPIREFKRWVSEPRNQIRKYLRALVPIVTRLFNALPLKEGAKARIKFEFACLMPRIFSAADIDPNLIKNDYRLMHPLPRIIPRPKAVNPETMHILSAERPMVSVIIPVYGKVDFTLQCLASIAANLPTASFEVIVIDDCSPDNSVEILKKVSGIRLIANEQNQGFIRSCNIGAAAALGEYFYFLNNDTEVTPGWMDELLRTFHEFPGTGFAGSKLIYPDGTLQEAGGIIWQDGSAWNFGREQNQSAPQFNYAREVDYCSGASIMVPAVLFRELGGFDEHYLPAYCEDSDLALKIRDKGYRVIYQPLSKVIHFEGVTSGTDVKQGAKAYQIENSKKLAQRWQQRLLAHQKNGEDVDSAKDRMLKRRVLVIEHTTPTPDQDAGSVSVFNIILLLRGMGYQVTFIPEDNFYFTPDYSARLQRIGVEVLYSPFCRSVEEHVKEFGPRYDLVFLFRPKVVANHISTIRQFCPSAKTLFYTHDIHHIRMEREAELVNSDAKRVEAYEMKKMEFDAMRSVDATIVVSTSEFDTLRPALPDIKMHILPLILEVPGTGKKFSDRAGIVFVGGYQHTPNVDAVTYFVSEVMPLLRNKLPGVVFHIVGSNAPKSIIEMKAPDINVVGFVEDLGTLLDTKRVAVAPLRYGAGIKGKIGTAMAAGLPTVATSMAAEGMSLTHNQDIILADGAELFSDEIARLYQNEALWNRLSETGISTARKMWGMEAANHNLQTILDDIGLLAIK